MDAVNTIDALKYGFRLLGYLLAVVILGGLLVLIGAAFDPGGLRQGNPILAVLFVLAGLAVIYAGGLGLLYKVIADGVAVGNRMATDRRGGVQPPTDAHQGGGAGEGGPRQPSGGTAGDRPER